MYTDSNNAAEYEALLHGLRMAVSMGIQRLEVRGDLNLAISQINREFDFHHVAACQRWRLTATPYSKYQLGSRGSSFITWPEKAIKQRTSLLASAPSATPSHLISSWKGYLSHPSYGKGRPVTIVRTRPQHQIPNTVTQSEALPSK